MKVNWKHWLTLNGLILVSINEMPVIDYYGGHVLCSLFVLEGLVLLLFILFILCTHGIGEDLFCLPMIQEWEQKYKIWA